MVNGLSLAQIVRIWTILIFVGLGATSLGFLGMFHTAEFVSPGVATAIANTQPLLAAILADMFFGEHGGAEVAVIASA